MISPRHILDTFKTILRPRESHKRLYLHCMMVMMLTHLVAIYAELYCQYMYTKRMFGWEVSDYSFFIMIQVFDTVIHAYPTLYKVIRHFLEIHNEWGRVGADPSVPPPQPE